MFDCECDSVNLMSKISVRLVSDYGRNRLDLTSDSKLYEIKQKAEDLGLYTRSKIIDEITN